MSNQTTATSGADSPAAEAFGSSDYADLIGARLLDFFGATSPWQRRLWDVGTCLLLREVVEATTWRAKRVLSDGAVSWLASDAVRSAGRDPALGSAVMRKQLTETLRSPLLDGSRHTRRLQELSALASDGYLDRWTQLLQSGKRPSIERLARGVAAHLLDLGYSMPFLRRWAKTHIRDGTDLEALLRSAAQLATESEQEYQALVPFRSVPGAKTPLTEREPTWRDASAVAAWLKENGSDSSGVRQVGGFLFKVRARDPFGAVVAATDRVDRLLSRATLARGHTDIPTPHGNVWVRGTTRAFKLDHSSRGAFVLSLVAEARLYDISERTELDDALELASVLNLGSPGPALASGWAAVEALLVSPQDPEDSRVGRGAVAADRLAALVACSWPRADLTALSYRHSPSAPDSLRARLEAATSNRERCQLVADALAAGTRLSLTLRSDQAAAERMSGLVAAPKATLRDVEAHVRSAMRRLYRQRNIVMHGGSTGTLTRDATLRTAAPLVGAGLDRIAHASANSTGTALELADRAYLSLELVGSPGGTKITELLERLASD